MQKATEKFWKDDKYDENYAEDGATILKHKNFNILSNIEYNKETKQFKIDKISEELKEMFLFFDIKKRFIIFKNVIVGLGNKNALKNLIISSIEHDFTPTKEREKIRRQEESAEEKINRLKNKRTRKETTKVKTYRPKQKNKFPTCLYQETKVYPLLLHHLSHRHRWLFQVLFLDQTKTF